MKVFCIAEARELEADSTFRAMRRGGEWVKVVEQGLSRDATE